METVYYYLGEENEGWAHTDWQYLEIDEDNMTPNGDESYDDEAWFYFGSNGKATKNERKYIKGAYYAFDENGVMNDRWVEGTPWSAELKIATPNSSYYNEEIGNQLTGWAYKYDNNDEDGDQDWYYLESSNKGVPFNYNAAAADANDNGNVLKYKAGKDVNRSNSTALKSGIYYFNKEDGSAEGQMMTGKQAVEYDGDTY